ncbi:hypothetical protein [Phenylobacterium sp.]|uniref:hypothetical protein n=1 Tax=Phenylobacterium sp. TaxID=1871053 RepID=UPI0025D02B0B|nr:hypothetical protein [Phenylobacterium sp.]|tara:strand:- start:457 stop:825 length:369 start_codon:yes stop_codon:yes gene_type:complete
MTKQRGYYTLKIGGKNRTLHFSMNFWATYTDLLGISLDEIGGVFEKGVSLKAIIMLVYAGILTYDQENKKEIDYDNFDVGNWLEDVGSEDIENIIKAMTESRILGNDLNAGIQRNSNDTKKK